MPVNLREISSKDLHMTLWRYMSFSKFMSLLTYQVLWFSRLDILQDHYEGMIPRVTKHRMDEENQQWKRHFTSPQHHAQIDNMTANNETSGRELLVVNCWFIGECESAHMWKEYGGSCDAVALKSTTDRLCRSVLMIPDGHASHIGRVTYVVHDTHEMTSYQANQAHERAFLKGNQFRNEKELRLVTMNFKTQHCVAKNGIPYSAEQVDGGGMNNVENPGLYVGAKIETLFSDVIVYPGAGEWFLRLVRRIIELYRIDALVSRSQLDSGVQIA